jgi:predicted nucleic acid-binding protein
MRIIFVDSCFWIGLRDARDGMNRLCTTIAQRILRMQYRLITTPYIFAETHARFSRSVVLRERIIRDFWENPIVSIESPTVADQAAALTILKEQKDKSYSFCDALSFAMMKRMNLREVLTFDDHFRQFGQFEVIDY